MAASALKSAQAAELMQAQNKQPMTSSSMLKLNWLEVQTWAIQSHLTLLKYTGKLCFSVPRSHLSDVALTIWPYLIKCSLDKGVTDWKFIQLQKHGNYRATLKHKHNLELKSYCLKLCWISISTPVSFTSRNSEPDCFLVNVCISNKHKSRDFSIDARQIVFLASSTTCQKTLGKSCNGSVT